MDNFYGPPEGYDPEQIQIKIPGSHIFKAFSYSSAGLLNRIAEYEELNNRLIAITGLSIEDILRKFEAGYALTPPIINKLDKEQR